MAKKKRASLTINKPIPMFKPLCTAKVWLPRYVASDIMSLNQSDIEKTNEKKPRLKLYPESVKPCILKTRLVVTVRRQTHVNIGQGEGETK